MGTESDFELWEVIQDLKDHLREFQLTIPDKTAVSSHIDGLLIELGKLDLEAGTDTIPLIDFSSWCDYLHLSRNKVIRTLKRPYPLIVSPRRLFLQHHGTCKGSTLDSSPRATVRHASATQ